MKSVSVPRILLRTLINAAVRLAYKHGVKFHEISETLKEAYVAYDSRELLGFSCVEAEEMNLLLECAYDKLLAIVVQVSVDKTR